MLQHRLGGVVPLERPHALLRLVVRHAGPAFDAVRRPLLVLEAGHAPGTRSSSRNSITRTMRWPVVPQQPAVGAHRDLGAALADRDRDRDRSALDAQQLVGDLRDHVAVLPSM
jgi:hypothetical protein